MGLRHGYHRGSAGVTAWFLGPQRRRGPQTSPRGGPHAGPPTPGGGAPSGRLPSPASGRPAGQSRGPWRGPAPRAGPDGSGEMPTRSNLGTTVGQLAARARRPPSRGARCRSRAAERPGRGERRPRDSAASRAAAGRSPPGARPRARKQAGFQAAPKSVGQLPGAATGPAGAAGSGMAPGPAPD